jgi:hypothetical protein
VLSSLAAWAWHHTAGAGTAAAAGPAALRQQQQHQDPRVAPQEWLGGVVGACGQGVVQMEQPQEAGICGQRV